MQARRGRTAGTSGPRSGAAADGGQYKRVSQSRKLLYSVSREELRAGHGRACGAAEHSGLGGLLQGAWNKSIFPCFLHVLAAETLRLR